MGFKSDSILADNIFISSSLEFSANTSSNEGITFGGDTTLYRFTSSILKTDGDLVVNGNIIQNGVSYAHIDAALLNDNDFIVKTTIEGEELFVGMSPIEVGHIINVQQSDTGSAALPYPKWNVATGKDQHTAEKDLGFTTFAFMNLLIGNDVSANDLPDIDCNKLKLDINTGE